MNFRGILDLFRRRNDSANSHIKNLIEMASADGKCAVEECQLLTSIAAREGITEKGIKEIKANMSAISFEVPKQEGERFSQIFDLVHMMVIDQDVHPDEMKLSESFASRFGYPKRAIKGLIETIRQNIQNGNDANNTHDRVLYYLKFNQLL